MADSTSTPSEKPNQPAAAAAVVAPATPAAGTPPPSPAKLVPVIDPNAAKPAEAAKPVEGEAAKPVEGAAPAAPAAPAIPETYDIKLPDELVKAGHTLDSALVAQLSPVFKELGLTQDSAQKLANAAIAYQQGLPKAMLARDLESTLKDPEVGGLNWARTQGNIKLALGAFTTAQERQWLERAGIGNRLEFVRVFDRIGKAMAAAGDVAERGTPDGSPETSVADRMYGKTNKS